MQLWVYATWVLCRGWDSRARLSRADRSAYDVSDESTGTVVLYLDHGLFDGCVGVAGLPLFHLGLDKEVVCGRLALGLVLLVCMGGEYMLWGA